MNPFDEIESVIFPDLLTAIEKNFQKHIQDGNVVVDYGTHFPLYKKLVVHCIEHKEQLLAQHKFTENMNYHGWVMYLLADQVKKRITRV